MPTILKLLIVLDEVKKAESQNMRDQYKGIGKSLRYHKTHFLEKRYTIDTIDVTEEDIKWKTQTSLILGETSGRVVSEKI